MLKVMFAAIPVVFLAACGGAPSDSDIQAALTKAADEQNKMFEGITGSNPAAKSMASGFKVTFTNARKIGCKEDGEKSYKCDVEVQASMGGAAPTKTVAPMRFVKG